ncbi:MAG TPA: transcription-repair coupling factor [Dermatophilaceae bacterium]|nr:transcription-repair coupling factor [Dermatophilaceae bacterium]
MHLSVVSDLLRADPGAARVLSLVGEPVVDVAVDAGARPALMAALARVPLLVVTATGREAEDLTAALRCYLPGAAVADFPAWETLPHERLSPRSDTVGRRLAVLRRLAHPEPGPIAGADASTVSGPLDVVVAPVRALLQPLVKGLGELAPVAAQAGDMLPLESLVEQLAAAAYTRTDLVERRGEFAVRGGIVDVFPPTEEHPLRVELWGDTVEEIRWFKVADQRSLEVAPRGLWAPACREVLLTGAVRARAAALAGQLPGVADLLGKLAEGIAVEGMESLAPALVEGMESLLDVLRPGTHVVLVEPERVRTRAHDLVATSQEFLQASWVNAAAGNAVPVDLESVLGQASYQTLAEVRGHALRTGRPWWTLSRFSADEELAEDAGEAGAAFVRVGCTDHKPYRGDTEQAVADLRGFVDSGSHVFVLTEGAGLAKRVVEVLAEHDVPARLVADDPTPTTGIVLVGTGTHGRGFVCDAARLVLLTEADLTGTTGQGGSTRDMRRMPSRRRNQVDPLQLRSGDHVVHEQHGVGRFVEMAQRTVGGATREYLVLEYGASRRGQAPDRLYVPTDQLDQVTKYVGGEAPTLNRLGGSDWARTKSQARRHVRQIAGELIRLYSARMATVGHAFAPDTPWQRELEDAFAYVETPDQLSSIEEVKADMERPVPMDRLICGDVGYGKTEVALRAAFKAANDGKQVMFLVPTTILAQQHFGTFSERLRDFPFTIEVASRFRSTKEVNAAIKGFQEGKVDVLIGTHRLLSRDVRPKDLGLLIVDEEQRFGVKQKELLRQLKLRVDVLSLSATPIPRTLQMSLAGLRDISVIETPPEGRRPVRTYVGEYDEELVKQAIERELSRNGQAFFLHNRVDSIDETAERIRAVVPRAKVAVAHGQMAEKTLESVMMDFVRGETDVLVCTTIVEAGLDISTANTLIVERADMLGLAQLYQIRGRVGRSRERAYAYLHYPSSGALTEEASQRLSTLSDYTELGSGFKIAMRDLEIRGAGNLLGDEQSGHVAAIGFELYVSMLDEAVALLAGTSADEMPEPVRIDVPVDAYVPGDYVPYEAAKIEIHRRISGAREIADLIVLREELEDRFGPVPDPLENLIKLQDARIKLGRAGAKDVGFSAGRLRVSPIELDSTGAKALRARLEGAVYESGRSTVSVRVPDEPAERFPALVAAAEAVLEVATDPLR